MDNADFTSTGTASTGNTFSVSVVSGTEYDVTVSNIDLSDAINIGKRTKPRKHIGEFLGFVLAIVTAQGRGKFTYLFDKPHERSGRAALAVTLAIPAANQLLKFFDLHILRLLN